MCSDLLENTVKQSLRDKVTTNKEADGCTNFVVVLQATAFEGGQFTFFIRYEVG